MFLSDLQLRLDVAARDVLPRFVPAGYHAPFSAAPKTTCPTGAQTEVKTYFCESLFCRSKDQPVDQVADSRKEEERMSR